MREKQNPNQTRRKDEKPKPPPQGRSGGIPGGRGRDWQNPKGQDPNQKVRETPVDQE